MVAWDDVAARVPALLEEIQGDMYAAARKKYDSCVQKVGVGSGRERA